MISQLRVILTWGEIMKRILARMVAATLATILFFTTQVQAMSAQKAIVLDAQTGRVLFEKNSDDRSLIASTTKIMTALIVCEQCNVLDRMRIPDEAVGIEGSSIYLKSGEILTIQELLYGLMLQSGNDAAVALAIYCGGTVEGFVQLMNDKAHLLGLKQTHFENPNGLDSPGHYSTAKDLAVLTAYAMRNPIFAQIVSTRTLHAGTRSMRNHNKLLWLYDGADGVKTGYTKAAGRILVSSATRQDRRLIAVTINAPDDWNDHIYMLDNGFRQFRVRQVITKGQCLGFVQVNGGTEQMVSLLAAEDFSYALTDDEQLCVVFPGPGFAYAPLAKGQSAGFAHLCLGDNSVYKMPLIYGETVELQQQPPKSFWQRFWKGDDT